MWMVGGCPMPMRRMLWKTMQAPQRSGSAYTEIGNKNVWELWLAKLKSVFYVTGHLCLGHTGWVLYGRAPKYLVVCSQLEIEAQRSLDFLYVNIDEYTVPSTSSSTQYAVPVPSRLQVCEYSLTSTGTPTVSPSDFLHTGHHQQLHHRDLQQHRHCIHDDWQGHHCHCDGVCCA